MRDQFFDCFAGLSSEKLTPEMYVEIIKMLEEIESRFPVAIKLSAGKRHKRIMDEYISLRYRRREKVRRKLSGYVRQFIADERKRLTQESPDKKPPNWPKDYALEVDRGDTPVTLRKKLALIDSENQIEDLIRKAESAVPLVAPPARVDGLVASAWRNRTDWRRMTKEEMLARLESERSAPSYPSARERAAMRRTFSKKGRKSRSNKGESMNPTTSV